MNKRAILPCSSFLAASHAGLPALGRDSRWWSRSAAKLSAAAVLLTFLLSPPAEAVPFTFSPTGAMSNARLFHTATLLRNGKVLVTGGGVAGEIDTAEIYDPATRRWSSTGSMTRQRSFHTATLLPDGKVLVAGGLSNSGGTQATAELYDPATGTWTATGSLSIPRDYHTATLLQNGKVLVAGGAYQASAELYDPATGTWTPTGSMSNGRDAHVATLLENGMVLVTGGRRVDSIAEAELYDPATGSWSPAGRTAAARASHTATLLPGGRVLVTAGYDYRNGRPLTGAELFNPATGSWTAAGNLAIARAFHTATLLPDGRVLVTGGLNSAGTVIATSQLYNPATGNWSSTGNLNTARTTHTATLLPNNHVLIAGGDGSGGHELASAELYETSGPSTTFRNLSTRARVETGDDVLIGGFIVTGSVSKRVIIRAIGPSLTARGVAGALPDPTLQLHKPDGTTVFNDNWKDDEAAVGPTELAPERDEEAAIVATLPPGLYTAIVRGKGDASGIALVEIYDLDTSVSSMLANVSTRSRVQTGDNVMIGGLIVGGSHNVTQVAVRGLGPSLADAGVPGVLADPVIDLRNSNGDRMSMNDNWQDDADAAAELTARNLAPSLPEEAALFTTLPPGNYTAIVSGRNGSSGVGLVEFYIIR